LFPPCSPVNHSISYSSNQEIINPEHQEHWPIGILLTGALSVDCEYIIGSHTRQMLESGI